MTLGVLQDIIEKVRELSASGNSSQVTDSKIIKYINSFYLYDLPDDLRVLKLKDIYTFNTIQGVDVYPFNFDAWSTVKAPAYCGKAQVTFFQDVENFYSYTFGVQQKENFDTADGTAGPYLGNTLSFPMLKSVYNNPMAQTKTAPTDIFPINYPVAGAVQATNISRIQNILISANTATGSLHVTDDGAGSLIGDVADATGTIDYQTGAIASLTFNATIPSGNEISIQYSPVTYSKPDSILFFQNQFVLRPVPDFAYTIEVTGYREPSQALLGTTSTTEFDLNGRPEHLDWWELLAFGASKKLYQDRLDMDGVQMMDQFIQEQISQARTRTCAQLGSRQMTTIYRDESNQMNGGGYGYGGY